jgi:hypothetical protein
LWEQPCGALKHSNRQHLALAANPDFMQRKPGKVDPGPDTASSKTTSLQPTFLVQAFEGLPQTAAVGPSRSLSFAFGTALPAPFRSLPIPVQRVSRGWDQALHLRIPFRLTGSNWLFHQPRDRSPHAIGVVALAHWRPTVTALNLWMASESQVTARAVAACLSSRAETAPRSHRQ